jgi:hypothetical protein
MLLVPYFIFLPFPLTHTTALTTPHTLYSSPPYRRASARNALNADPVPPSGWCDE